MATSASAAPAIVRWTAAISVLVVVASVLGLADRDTYAQETSNWATQAKGQDLGNLLAVGCLLLAAHRYRRGSLRAGLVWLGALLYLVYAYVVYSVAVHFNELFLVYVAILGLSSFAVMTSMAGLRAGLRAGPDHYPDGSARTTAGRTSIAIGVLFGLLWLRELIPATLSGTAPPSVVEAGLWINPVHVIDLAILLPALILAGHQTLRRREPGMFLVAPLLVLSVLMGTSIVATLVLMTAAGGVGTWPPLVMVSLVVVASLVAVRRYLGSGVGLDSQHGALGVEQDPLGVAAQDQLADG